MATQYTDQNIVDAYKQAMAGGAKEADFVAEAKNRGVTDDQLKSAYASMTGNAWTAPASAPASASASAPTGLLGGAYDQSTINTLYEEQLRGGQDQAGIWAAGQKYGLTEDQLKSAQSAFDQKVSSLRNWSNGKSADEILHKAEEMNLSPQDLALIFGTNVQDVYNNVGFGQEVVNGKIQNRYGAWAGSPSSERTLSNGVRAGAPFYNAETNTWGAQPKRGSSSAGGASADIQYMPQLNRQIDDSKETIEGRIKNLLGTDANGNFTNPVVRQAVDRTMQAFAGRGLLNSSMAQQAAYEAAIAKAIEIAGPDAQTYFQQGRANQDATNVFARDNQSYLYDLGKIAAQGDQTIRAQNNQNSFTAGQQDKQNQFTAGQTQAQRDWQTTENTANRGWQSQENAANRAAQLQASATSASASLTAAQLSAGTQMQVAEMNRQYSQLAGLSSTTNTLLTNYNNSVVRIVESDLTPQAKEQAIGLYTNTLKSGIQLQGSIAGDINMTELLNNLFPTG